MRFRFVSALAVSLLCLRTVPLHAAGDPSTVLVLVNDAWPAEAGTGGVGASVFVGQHYAQLRNIPAQNVLHLNIPLSVMHASPTMDFISYADYMTYIQTPVQTYMSQQNLTNQILYIVPTYGIPYMLDSLPGDSAQTGRVSLDSVLAGMYSGFTGIWGSNPYHTASSTNLPTHFKDWINPSQWKMYLVTRLDGPSALIAAGLVDKAVSAETTLHKTEGTGYYDYEHRLVNDDYGVVDQTMLNAYNLSVAEGIPSVLNDQSVTGGMFSPASTYAFTGSSVSIFTESLSTVTMRWSFAPTGSGTFRTTFANLSNFFYQGQFAWYRLYSSDRQSYWELSYPMPGAYVPNATLSKISNATTLASCQIAVSTIPWPTDLSFTFGDSQGQVLKNGTPLCTLTDASSTHIAVSQGEIVYRDVSLSLTGVYIQDSGNNFVWNDSFTTDPATRYSWLTMPKQAQNALFIWGWYGAVHDAYTVANGAVGTQMTSYTANYIRSFGIPEQDSQWVPYFLRLGITATWGATGEPYTIGYAMADNLFNHFWHGYNFAESAYLANPYLNWMMVFVGDPLYSPAAFATSATPPTMCDINGDSAVNVLDIQLSVNQALQILPCTADIDQDHACNVIDVQRVVNAVLSGTCIVGL